MAQERIPLEEMTLRQLRKVASEYGVSRYSRMRKSQLIEAIRALQPTNGSASPSVSPVSPTPSAEAPARIEELAASTPSPTEAVHAVISSTINEPMNGVVETSTPPANLPIAPTLATRATEEVNVMQDQESKEFEVQAGSPVSSLSETSATQEAVEATKFEVGQGIPPTPEEMAAIDADLPDLPGGYGEGRVVILPRDPQWAYCYWDVPNEQKEELRRQGGQQLALRIYDATDINLNYQAPHSIQEYPCDELAREWYLPIPVSDRDYIVDIGYRTGDGRWLVLTRSAPVHVPPVFPSDWVDDTFITIPWEEDLRGKTFATLVPPAKQVIKGQPNPVYDDIFKLADSTEAQRIAGSLFGSMHQVPEESLSSYVFPSGVGSWAVPTMSGLGMITASGAGMMAAAEASELTLSGVGMGVGFSASVPQQQAPRKFWLVADAELIVYGATEPDATVTIGGRPIKLNPDGTFRFQMSFQDGVIDYPILAVAADGVQTRSVHMNFERQTPSRNTNTKEEAVEEWVY